MVGRPLANVVTDSEHDERGMSGARDSNAAKGAKLRGRMWGWRKRWWVRAGDDAEGSSSGRLTTRAIPTSSKPTATCYPANNSLTKERGKGNKGRQKAGRQKHRTTESRTTYRTSYIPLFVTTMQPVYNQPHLPAMLEYYVRIT
jgi:hypothetical protein